jgi:FAD/FMN-containing dehydrogenase
VVHADVAPGVVMASESVVAVHRRLKALFDPSGRLNPGRMPFGIDTPVGVR